MRPTGTSPGKTGTRTARDHAGLLRGEAATANDPLPGWYERRLVKDGPRVPARIWVVDGDRDERGELTSDQRVCCLVWYEDGPREVDAWEHWTFLAPITKAVFDSMVATMDWARGTTAAEGRPREPVDLRKERAIF